ncbi:DUF4411 domain-containing protein [Sporosarcina sp. FSL W8-0480]|uniref:DUF4411 domain-containing protein n=1 Tax=Sporosarcina sp. FSL W8-0480 TaxID=2954701 RepID=UPI0030D8AE2E
MKQYTLDTNVFRYKTNPTGDHALRNSAKSFWKGTLREIQSGEAVLLVPEEVVRELKVQSFTLAEKEKRKIADLLGFCQEVSPNRLSIEIEHKIRELSAYVRSNFKSDIGQDKMEYGGISDSRILYTAYDEDSILVTANVKDFLLYPLLFPHNEERLFDMKENKFVRIPEQGYYKIHSDIGFKSMLQSFFEFDNEQ